MGRSNYATALSAQHTPQSEPLPGREAEMEQNRAGGFVFKLNIWDRLHRFLVLGSDSGTYYAGGRELTKECAQTIKECLAENPSATIAKIVDVSEKGRAPSNDPALFALAVACSHSDSGVVNYAFSVLPRVARIGTHILHFVDYLDGMRGWGRAAKRGVARWYDPTHWNDPVTGEGLERLAFQVAKYRQRDKWSHRDVLRLCHPATKDPDLNALYKWIVSQDTPNQRVPQSIRQWQRFQKADLEGTLALLKEFPRTPREFINTEFLKDDRVWRALFPRMPIGALLRNLPTLTRRGVLKPLSEETARTCSLLKDKEVIAKGRIHPLRTLVALKTYESGESMRGSSTWSPVPEIVKALDKAFYLGFDTVPHISKRLYVAIDISGSMGFSRLADLPMTPREAAAAMAMVFAKHADRSYMRGFHHDMCDLHIDGDDTLKTVLTKTRSAQFGATDCARPIKDAIDKGLSVDAFIVLTDGETWYGGPDNKHVTAALTDYRRRTGIPTKMVCVSMTANNTSLVDPKDPLTLDVVGFDTNIPSLVEDFIRQ